MEGINSPASACFLWSARRRAGPGGGETERGGGGPRSFGQALSLEQVMRVANLGPKLGPNLLPAPVPVYVHPQLSHAPPKATRGSLPVNDR